MEIVREAIRELEQLEYDALNDKVRVRENWKMWLMPNPEGGFGLPQWSITAVPEADASEEGAKGLADEEGEEAETEEVEGADAGAAGDVTEETPAGAVDA